MCPTGPDGCCHSFSDLRGAGSMQVPGARAHTHQGGVVEHISPRARRPLSMPPPTPSASLPLPVQGSGPLRLPLGALCSPCLNAGTPFQHADQRVTGVPRSDPTGAQSLPPTHRPSCCRVCRKESWAACVYLLWKVSVQNGSNLTPQLKGTTRGTVIPVCSEDPLKT